MKVISLENLKTFYNNSKKFLGNMTNITYAELKTLRDNSQLVEGQYYRITDFVTTVDQEDAKSARHRFDIIVLATSSNTLNENALAAKHAEDTYFNNSNLDAWELKYDLDNDKSKYAWADQTNGKGVIYYMKDEFNNECSYDFKNVLFKRYKLKNKSGLHLADYPLEDLDYDDPIKQAFINWQSYLGTSMNSNNVSFYYTRSDGYLVSGAYIYDYDSSYESYDRGNLVFNESSGGSYVALCSISNSFDIIAEVENTNGEWFYTFSKKTTATDAAVDASLSKLTNIKCYSNSIKEYIKSSLYYLNNNIFIVLGNTGQMYSNNFNIDCYYNTFGSSCSGNTFGSSCSTNTFGNGCYGNTFENNCSTNTFGYSCGSNTFGYSCDSNTFENSCYGNTFENNCNNNTFGSSCSGNTFGSSCSTNKFGNSCGSNTFGNSCDSNTFENSCYGNTFGYSCDSNTFGDSYLHNKFGNSCGSNTFGNGCNSNKFENSCESNTFGNDCDSNTFGDDCSRNTFGDDCNSNKFGDSCESNTFGSYYYYNTFGSDIYNVSFELYTTGLSKKIQYLIIYQVSSKTIPSDLITLGANYSQVLGLNSSGALVCKPVLD